MLSRSACRPVQRLVGIPIVILVGGPIPEEEQGGGARSAPRARPAIGWETLPWSGPGVIPGVIPALSGAAHLEHAGRGRWGCRMGFECFGSRPARDSGSSRSAQIRMRRLGCPSGSSEVSAAFREAFGRTCPEPDRVACRLSAPDALALSVLRRGGGSDGVADSILPAP